LALIGVERVEKLSPKQRKATQLLASGHTLSSICTDLNISDETLRIWRNKPEFQAKVDELLKLEEIETMQLLRGTLRKAVETIYELMGKEQDTRIRLQAAQSMVKQVKLELAINDINRQAELNKKEQELNERENILQQDESAVMIRYFEKYSDAVCDGLKQLQNEL